MLEFDDGGALGEGGWSSAEGDPMGIGAAAAAEVEGGWSSDEGSTDGGWAEPEGWQEQTSSSEGWTSEGDPEFEPGAGNIW